MQEFRKEIRGRGASSNTLNRFERLHLEMEPQNWDNYSDEKPLLRTEFYRDFSKTILTENSSPDIPFRYSINPYRGCEHGCAYCYARPTHEYLGYSAGLDFESKIFVKTDAPELLRKALESPKWKPESITISGVTDCYQPIERQLSITRRCLQILAEFRNPVSLITKNQLVCRDIDILSELAQFNAVLVYISVTSLDDKLAARLEPRTSRPQARLQAIEKLAAGGIPVGVNVAPVIPGLNDHEIPGILKAAAQSGAKFAGYVPLRLPLAVAPLFSEWLEVNVPGRKKKVLDHIRSMREGKLNDANFGSRMKGRGVLADHLLQIFSLYSRKVGLNMQRAQLSVESFRRPTNQLKLNLE